MFHYEKSLTGKADLEKIWQLYVDINKWPLWDKSVQSVSLPDGFVPGAKGVMVMADGGKIPIILTECTKCESFSVESKLGPFTVTLGHFLKEDADGVTITHTVEIAGGEENQMKGIAEKITAGIPACLQALISA